MKSSVIVPTFNRRDILARTLPLLLDQEFSPQDYEVVIAVDGSTDGTAEMVRSMVAPCRIKVIEQVRRGAAAARNAAVAAACGSLLLFLDDDILCSSTLISEHFAAHSGDGATERMVTHGPIFVAPESPPTLITCGTRQWYETYNRQFTTDKSLDVYRQGFLISNTCMRRELFVASGGFDSAMILLEDTELGIRLSKSGAHFTYLPNAVVQEIFSKSTWSYVNNDAARHGKAEIVLCRKHSDYRPFSALSNLGGSTITRRLLRRLAIWSSVILQPLLNLLLSVLERLTHFERCRRAGLFLLGVSYRLVFLRSAAREVGSYRALMRQYGMQLPVLLYHNVGPVRWTRFPGLTIPPKRFENQMRSLAARGYSTIRSADWIAWVKRGVPLPSKPVLLTFDDGYADLVTHAFPVLRQLGFTAEVFVVTSLLGGTNAWDHDGKLGTHTLMTRQDIEAWSKKGICFGAHSRTHPNLTKLSAAYIQDEIEGSAKDLAEVIGETPVTFAYPYGYQNATVKESAKRFFHCAFSTENGLNDLRTDLFALKRLWIPPDRSLLDFACRVYMGWSPISELRSFLRLRSRAKWMMHMMHLSR